VTGPSANFIGTLGPRAEQERRLEKAELRRMHHGRLVSRRELNATVQATIYGWGGTARLGEWDARRFRAIPDPPMGSRLSTSLREPPTDHHASAKPPHRLGRTRRERES